MDVVVGTAGNRVLKPVYSSGFVVVALLLLLLLAATGWLLLANWL